ncbi:MAG: hypothetical protein AAF580_05775 [Pseudomonadota bacterium]
MSQSQLTAIPQGGTTPAIDAFPIVPTDGVDLPSLARALYIGSAGDITITTAAGSSVTFVGVSAGTVLPVHTCQVAATGTTAAHLIGLV